MLYLPFCWSFFQYYMAPIHIAASNNEIFLFLASHGGDLQAMDNHKKTPIFYAINARNIETCMFILSKSDSADHKCNDQRTPLHDAAERGLTDVCRTLIEKGANINSQNWNLLMVFKMQHLFISLQHMEGMTLSSY